MTERRGRLKSYTGHKFEIEKLSRVTENDIVELESL